MIDLNLMHLFVDEAAIEKNQTILEVGHGTGSMTDLLATRGGKVVAVDIDNDLAHIAKEALCDHNNIIFINEDALNKKSLISPTVQDAITSSVNALGGTFKLVANLPYQIASPLMINLIMSELNPEGLFVTIQLEVGQRILANEGSKAYGLMSILMQATGDVTLVRTLPQQAFWPPPKIKSAMVAWRRNEEKIAAISDLACFKKVIDMLLRHRRKMIRTALIKNAFGINLLPVAESLNIETTLRGEALPVKTIIAMANAIYPLTK